MIDALALLPALLAPVAALLLLNLRLSRRLSYPHTLLAPDARRGPASFLFRSIRTYYDIFLDAAIATILAFALGPLVASPASRGRAAAVLDCSRSMLAGSFGSRPIEVAIRRMTTDPALKAADRFALTFDPEARRSRLVPIDGYLRDVNAAQAARRLETEFDFFAVDLSALAELRKRGYGEITLLTDRLPSRIEGFTAVESGFVATFAAYPATVRFDRAADSWLVALAESGPRGTVGLSAWNEERGGFVPLARDRFVVEEAPDGRAVRLSSPGLYRISIRAPDGQLDVDLPFIVDAKTSKAAASGPFSERMLEVFPLLVASERPEIALVDLGSRSRPGSFDGASIRVVTTLVSSGEDYVVDPSLGAGRPIASALLGGADFALGPAALANDDLVLAYDAVIRGRAAPAFVTRTPADTRSLTPVGGGYLAMTREGLVPLVPPPEEFFEMSTNEVVALPDPEPSRLWWALALALLAIAKLGLWRVFSGKKLLRTDEGTPSLRGLNKRRGANA